MTEQEKKQKETIVSLISQKSVMKQDVFNNTISVFNDLKTILKKVTDELAKETSHIDKRVNLNYKDVTPQSMQIKVAGDVLDFFMHTNVFDFEKSHPMFKNGYVKNNVLNSYCGIINVYNFLADSFKYNRLNDVGYLVARIFINREKRFFIETKTQIGYKYANFSAEEITKEQLTDIVNELIIFAISFDLLTPPFDAVRQVTVMEIQEKANSNALRTGKRLGFVGTEGSNSNFDDELNL
jgi:hypothetical protein